MGAGGLGAGQPKYPVFSALVNSTKKGYSNFLEKVFVFQKNCFKVKALKTLKIFSDCVT